MKNCLHAVVLYIYCLKTSELILCALLAALVICCISKKYSDRQWLRPCARLALVLWFGVVLWMTLLSRDPGPYAINWIPAHTYREILSGTNPEAFRSAAMNMMLFYPSGLLWGSLIPQSRSFPRSAFPAVALLSLFSLMIELSQYYFRLGVSEFDDVLHNTLGAAIGFSLFYLFKKHSDIRKND